jgi:SAM-dependent methyltransferase
VLEADKETADNTDYRAGFYAQYHRALGITPARPSDAQLAIVQRHFAGRWDHWLPEDRSCNCLDLGCGTGEFLLYLRSRGFASVQGVDLSGEELEVARSLGAADVQQADAIGFIANAPSASYGVISAFNFFEHLTKAEIMKVLPQVHRVLKPGGVLLAVTPNGLSPFASATRYWDFSHETGFTPASWRQLARLYEFGEVSFEEYGPLPHSAVGLARTMIWRALRLGIMAVSYVEVGGPRDDSRVYTADMKIILQR